MLPIPKAPVLLRLPVSRRLLALCALLLALLPCSRAQTALFPNPTVIPTGNWPAAVYTADLNNDGIPDLVYIDQGARPGVSSVAHVLLGSSNGQFTESAQLPIRGDALVIADFDGDNRLDLAWADVTGITVQGLVASGRGDGTFAAPAVFGSVVASGLKAAVPGFLASLQFQDTGHPYLLVEDVANLVVYFVTDRKAAGLTLLSEGLPDGPGPILTTNLLGTAYQQYAIANKTSVDIFFPTGTGVVGKSPKGYPYDHYTGAGIIASAIFKDVNNDGRPDLIAEGPNGRIDVYPGNGDGTFSTTSVGGTGTLDGLTGNGGHLIAVADLNHDGLPDALTSTPIGVSALLGNGTSYLGLKGIFNAGPGMHSFATADFNGDGNLDLATDSPEGIAILYGKGDGTFETSQAFAAGAPALSAASGRFTRSGNTDVVVSTAATQAQLLRGQADGTLVYNGAPSKPIPFGPAGSPAGLWSTVQAADFDGDGNLDFVLTADGSNSNLPPFGDKRVGVQPLFGDGTGNFTPGSISYTLYGGPGTITCSAPYRYPARLYGTSIPTIFTPGGPPVLAVRDDLAFQVQPVLPAAGSSGGGWAYGGNIASSACVVDAHDLVATADFNGDGYPDLLFQKGGSLFVFLNSKQKTFQQIGDLSVDGSLTTPGQLVAPQLAPNFPGVSPTLGQAYFPGSIATGDLDGDGQVDLLVTYAALNADRTAPSASAPNYLYLWFGSGGGKFLATAKHPMNPVRITLSRNYYQVALADVNGDGIPDLLLSDGYLFSYQLGAGDGSFGPEHHLLAGQGINTMLAADLRGSGRKDLLFANGGTLFSNPVANLDTLTPNPDVNTGGVTSLLNAGAAAQPIAPAGTLTASPEPSPFESAVTLTATLTSPAATGPAPTGTVTFSVAGVQAGSAPLSGGTATLALAAPFPAYLNGKALLPGTYPLTATYSGDANYGPATLTASHTVLLGPTSVVLTPTTPLQTFYGQPIDGTFSVSVVDSNYGTTGTYTLFDNGIAVPVCTNLPLTLNGKPLACPYGNPIFLDAGTHSFSVVYNGGPGNGDPVNDSSAASNVITYVALPDLTTAVSLTSSLNPSTVGQPVTFTATFTSNVATPTGQVRFLDGSAIIGTGTLGATGVATFTTSTLAAGNHPITAVYDATTNFSAATSVALNQIVNPAAPLGTTIVLGSSLNPSRFGQPVTFTASLVTGLGAGTFDFLDGTVTLASVAANASGAASFTTSRLQVGTHVITAVFRSSQSALATVSGPLNQVVLAATPPAAPFGLTVSPNPVTIGVGRTAVLLVTVTGPLSSTLTCTDSFDESACLFSQSQFPAGGGATSLQLTTAAPHDCGDPTHPYFLGSVSQNRRLPGRPAALLAGLAACGLLARKRRRLAGLMFSFAGLFALLSTLSGCGRCTDLGTRPGSYRITVQATQSDGSTLQVTVPVTVRIPGE